MRDDDTYPRQVSDPAADGIPDYADDDSTAYDEVESTRVADGPDPVALPGDREDRPLALDEFGTTPDEQLRGESLDQQLARELPEPSERDLPESPLRDFDDDPLDPHLDSPVSVYDRPGLDPLAETRVGRLVAPDEGDYAVRETDEIAEDAGAAGGGPAAEEAAMHEVPEE
jgi:hypothetical protein